MAGVDQLLQPVWAAVAVLRRKRINAVITPVTLSGKLGHRHQLKSGYAELFQVVKPGDRSLKGAFRGECPDMQFVDDAGFKGNSLPTAIFPGKNRVKQL